MRKFQRMLLSISFIVNNIPRNHMSFEPSFLPFDVLPRLGFSRRHRLLEVILPRTQRRSGRTPIARIAGRSGSSRRADNRLHLLERPLSSSSDRSAHRPGRGARRDPRPRRGVPCPASSSTGVSASLSAIRRATAPSRSITSSARTIRCVSAGARRAAMTGSRTL